VKMDLRRIIKISAVMFACLLPQYSAAMDSHRAKSFLKKHRIPCTLKHLCVSYDANNASLNYSNGEYYNYEHQGKFYNYIHNGKYYAHLEDGIFYNYSRDGKLYTTCTNQPGAWQSGKWVVPPPVCV
jgi:hypothetical protein